MNDLTLIGLIMIIIGVVLAIPTCFISLIILGIIGFVLILIGETSPGPYQTPYAPTYQQYPYQPYSPQHRSYPPPTSPCPVCGVPMRYVQLYNNWYCDYCRSYR